MKVWKEGARWIYSAVALYVTVMSSSGGDAGTSRVPVTYFHKAETSRLPGQTLRCLGGRGSIVGYLGPKGLGMLELGLV